MVVDDVGTEGSAKVDPQRLADLGLPPPSYRLETSPGNEQWGYLLSVPEENPHRIDAVVNAFVLAGITEDGLDPGMKGVTRYVRFPMGSNTKAKYRDKKDNPFTCAMREWDPERRYSIEALAECVGADLGAADVQQYGGFVDAAGATGSHADLIQRTEDLGLAKGWNSKGNLEVTCPWVDGHTDGVDDGAAILFFEKGPVFRCHHGHCERRGIGDYLGKTGVMASEALAAEEDPFRCRHRGEPADGADRRRQWDGELGRFPEARRAVSRRRQ